MLLFLNIWPALCLLLTIQAAQAGPLKRCDTIRISYRSMRSNFNLERLRQQLRDLVDGCQVVDGDVIIKNFGADSISRRPVGGDFRKLNTDFLDSIQEIYGHLIIDFVNLERLTFRNLRIIRGCNYEHYGAEKSLFALDIVQAKFPMKLQFPKLTSIATCTDYSSVRVIGETHPDVYCYLAKYVDWSSLFNQPSNQRFQDDVIKVRPLAFARCSSVPRCLQDCTHHSRRRFCWSRGPLGCQSTSHVCNTKNCKSCYKYRSARFGIGLWLGFWGGCCDKECLGGCSGPGPQHCRSCRAVNKDGVCRKDCNSDTADGSSSAASLVWQLRFQCLNACPMLYLVTAGSKICVSKCPAGEIPVDGVCKECPSCVTCHLESRVLSDGKAAELKSERCSVWDAVVSLDVGTPALTNSASAGALEHLRVFYGRLQIKRISRLGVTNLRVLRNVEFVSQSFVIMMVNVRYLGLAKLKYTKLLGIYRVSGLCRVWYPSKRLKELGKKFKVKLVGIKFDDDSKECREAGCHRDCVDECWGPGPDMCVENRHS